MPHEYRSLVGAQRTAHGPRQVTVATLGKRPRWDEQVPAGGEQLDKLLDCQPCPQQLPLPDGTTPVAPAPATELPEWRTLHVCGVRVERIRDFGAVYLASWRRRSQHTLRHELLPPGREDRPGEAVVCALTIARFDRRPSELGVVERWYQPICRS